MGRLLQFLKMDLSLPWGHADFGGNSSAVQDRLRCVQQIQATWGVCCNSWKWICRYLGVMQTLAGTARQFKIGSGVCGRFRPQMGPLLRFCKMDPSCMGSCRLWREQLGSSRSAQVCAADSGHRWGLCCDSARWICCDLGSWKEWRWQFGSSSASTGCYADSSHTSRFKPHVRHSLRFWKMDPSWPGVMQSMAGTVRQFKIGSGVCSKFKPQVVRLLQFLKMDLSIPGVMQTVVVTVRQFEISSRLFSPVACVGWKMPQVAVCLEENKCRCSLNWDTKSLRRFAVSRFVRDEAFEPTLNVVRLQDIQKSGVRTPKFVVGDFPLATYFHIFLTLYPTPFLSIIPTPKTVAWK